MQPVSLDVPAFDALAQDYDTTFSDSPLGSVLRSLVWERVGRHFAGARRILDLGCGTGVDALHLAARAERVLGIDISGEMIDAARTKAQRAPQGARLEFRCAPLEDLEQALQGERFDAVLSNFGALNCVADLGGLAGNVARHLEPGARLLWVLMGRNVPWEWLWFAGRGELRKALRRRARGGTTWRGMRVHYPSPRTVAKMLRPHFSIEALRPVGCLLPPSYAAGLVNARPRLLGTLARLERAALRVPALAYVADHYLIEGVRSHEAEVRAA